MLAVGHVSLARAAAVKASSQRSLEKASTAAVVLPVGPAGKHDEQPPALVWETALLAAAVAELVELTKGLVFVLLARRRLEGLMDTSGG